jgi:hypothetical protein
MTELKRLETQVNALFRALQAQPQSSRLRETYQHVLRMYRIQRQKIGGAQ